MLTKGHILFYCCKCCCIGSVKREHGPSHLPLSFTNNQPPPKIPFQNHPPTFPQSTTIIAPPTGGRSLPFSVDCLIVAFSDGHSIEFPSRLATTLHALANASNALIIHIISHSIRLVLTSPKLKTLKLEPFIVTVCVRHPHHMEG